MKNIDIIEIFEKYKSFQDQLSGKYGPLSNKAYDILESRFNAWLNSEVSCAQDSSKQ